MQMYIFRGPGKRRNRAPGRREAVLAALFLLAMVGVYVYTGRVTAPPEVFWPRVPEELPGPPAAPPEAGAATPAGAAAQGGARTGGGAGAEGETAGETAASHSPDASRPSATAQAAAPDLPATAPERLSPPVEGRAGAGFGWALSPTMGDWRYHPGLDFPAPEGTPVRAAAAGRVRRVRQSREWGWEITVDHGGGLATRYAGCRSARVKPGSAVEAGEILGEVGGDGLYEVEEGPHLHFEVLMGATPRNPRVYLR